MIENQIARPRALLVAVDLGQYDVETSLDELAELAQSADIEVIAKASQKRTELDSATCIGKGRLEEITEQCHAEEIDMLIFDHELSGSQLRNIEKITELEVVDRTMLILDIFSQRAHTSAGRLQVELAMQKYRLPRLMGQGQALSRLGGSSGLSNRGPGETKLESDRRHIRRRITTLEHQLKELENRRGLLRNRRKKDGVTTVAIVGYTNVGKSTLLNALTNAGVLAEDKLFATLDPTSRALLLPDGRSVLLIDTVGLVRRLPHHLVEAFKSTLEEAATADLLLCVCDASSDEAEEQVAVTKKLFAELGVENTPIITVLNKCDKLPALPAAVGKQTVLLSAKTGYGFDALLNTIAENLAPSQLRLKLLIPFEKGELLSQIRVDGKVFLEEYTPAGTQVDALVDRKILHKVEHYVQH